ncbi:MAG: carboxypeptidase regulatory-like domain-containing protein, partial [Bacteroidota bacterium]
MNTRILLIIACLLGGMSLELSAQDTQTLRGRVEALNGSTISGAEIVVVGYSAGIVTDESGRFEIKNLPTLKPLIVYCLLGADTIGSTEVLLN